MASSGGLLDLDLKSLAAGRLEPINSLHSVYEPMSAEMAVTGARIADDALRTVWTALVSLELRQAVAPQLHLDPATLPPGFGRQSGGAIEQLFLQRINQAIDAIGSGALYASPIYSDEPHLNRVQLREFVAWSISESIPCPPEWDSAHLRGRNGATVHEVETSPPTATPTPAQPVAKKRPREVEPLPSVYREADLLRGVVPFSKATLWRKVNAGTFPRPIKYSTGVTAWRRSEVEAWLEQQGAVDVRSRKA